MSRPGLRGQKKNAPVGRFDAPTERAVQLQSDTGIASKCDGGATSKCDPVQLQSDTGITSKCDPVQLQSGTGITSKCDGGATSKCYPVPLQSSNKDSSINDPSIINPTIRYDNPSRKKEPRHIGYDKPSRKREPRHRYGEYRNVLLSDSDLRKLQEEFPADWEERIENLGNYMESKGKTYRNHLATIRFWAARRDSEPRSKGAGRNESRWEKTEEEKQDEDAWMMNVIRC